MAQLQIYLVRFGRIENRLLEGMKLVPGRIYIVSQADRCRKVPGVVSFRLAIALMQTAA